MKNFCLIGCPLGHSKSPFIHKELMKIKGTQGKYIINEITSDDISSSKNNLLRFDGFNVTIPHKLNIIPLLDDMDEKARLFGSVNTVKNQNGKLVGYNTDCYGFTRSLAGAKIDLGGKVLLCGNGGVARMFAFEAVLAGAQLTICARDMQKSTAIQKEIDEKLGKSVKIISLDDLSGEYDLLINGTSVGMSPNSNASILPIEKVSKCSNVFDAVYNPPQTKLLTYAKESNAKYLNGLPMLVWQAVVAQEIWNDTKYTFDEVQSVIDKCGFQN